MEQIYINKLIKQQKIKESLFYLFIQILNKTRDKKAAVNVENHRNNEE
jgi:hypothetical protein